MTARDLSPTQKAVRVLVAQHLPGVPADLVTAYAEHIHIDTPFGQFGLSDVDHIHLVIAVEKLFGFEMTDEQAEGAKNVRQLAALVERHAKAEAA